MSLKKSLATMVTAGVLVGGLGAGAAHAEGTADADKPQSRRPKIAQHFDCSKLSQVTDIQARLKQNIDDRIAILEDLKETLDGQAAARVQKQIDRLTQRKTKMDGRLAKLQQHCSNAGSTPSA